MQESTTNDWAQGSLQLLSPTELLEALAAKRFSGRLVLISAATPRRVVALHLDGGRPVMVVGTGLPRDAGLEEESFRARQVLLEALGWSMGNFRVESGEAMLAPDARRQLLGSGADLIQSSSERARMWTALVSRLPGDYDDVLVAPGDPDFETTAPELRNILHNLGEATALCELARRCAVDEHVVLGDVLRLVDEGAVVLGTEGQLATSTDPGLTPVVAKLLETLDATDADNKVFKITVISWDARTCYRAVEALMGRSRTPPGSVEKEPRYHVLHEHANLADGYKLEVLAFRADTFEPVFAAPLVQDCQLFLLFLDLEAGHLVDSDQPLVDRINEVRAMFQSTAVAGRITLGYGAVTDPGCDMILPELGRFISWEDISDQSFLPGILREIGNRVGLDFEN